MMKFSNFNIEEGERKNRRDTKFIQSIEEDLEKRIEELDKKATKPKKEAKGKTVKKKKKTMIIEDELNN
jgi:RNA processing factor Prp31